MKRFIATAAAVLIVASTASAADQDESLAALIAADEILDCVWTARQQAEPFRYSSPMAMAFWAAGESNRLEAVDHFDSALSNHNQGLYNAAIHDCGQLNMPAVAAISVYMMVFPY